MSADLIPSKGYLEVTKDFDRILVVGDIHGQGNIPYLMYKYFTGINTIEKNYIKVGEKLGAKIGDKTAIVFTGDYIDRGDKNREIIEFLTGLKKSKKDNIILLKGNHETFYDDGSTDVSPANFKNDYKAKYNDDWKNYFKTTFKPFIEDLYLSAKIGPFCFVHGGPSDDEYLALWSDPDKNYDVNFSGSGRPYFGKKQTEDFLKQKNAKLLIRGHNDFTAFTQHDKLVITNVTLENKNLGIDKYVNSVIDITKTGKKYKVEAKNLKDGRIIIFQESYKSGSVFNGIYVDASAPAVSAAAPVQARPQIHVISPATISSYAAPVQKTAKATPQPARAQQIKNVPFVPATVPQKATASKKTTAPVNIVQTRKQQVQEKSERFHTEYLNGEKIFEDAILSFIFPLWGIPKLAFDLGKGAYNYIFENA